VCQATDNVVATETKVEENGVNDAKIEDEVLPVETVPSPKEKGIKREKSADEESDESDIQPATKRRRRSKEGRRNGRKSSPAADKAAVAPDKVVKVTTEKAIQKASGEVTPVEEKEILDIDQEEELSISEEEEEEKPELKKKEIEKVQATLKKQRE
jgi:hypothetical protein